MSGKPLLLDGYCGAGGAGMGYSELFDVVGVDKDPQPDYPFEFHQGDFFEFVWAHGHHFDAAHASPPCQHDSVASKSHNGRPQDHPDLIAPTREALLTLGVPYVIENVAGARRKLIDPIMLCGTMFHGLRVTRHRYFECHGFRPHPPPHGHHPLHYTLDKRKPHYGKLDEMVDFVMVNGGGNCSVAAAADAMGIDWMTTKHDLNEAIPPAYTRWLAARLVLALPYGPRRDSGPATRLFAGVRERSRVAEDHDHGTA